MRLGAHAAVMQQQHVLARLDFQVAVADQAMPLAVAAGPPVAWQSRAGRLLGDGQHDVEVATFWLLDLSVAVRRING